MSAISYLTTANKLLLSSLGDLSAATIKCAIVTSSYVYDEDHETLEDISDYVLGEATLTSLAVSGGELTCANFAFTGISSGTGAALVYYTSSGTPSTSYLLGYDSSATNLPYTFTGSDVPVTAPAYLIKITLV
ncbi:MAG: hypothetical protein WC455_28660 [Dehalococcoidia bacterium]|jgi:hypothetical protein